LVARRGPYFSRSLALRGNGINSMIQDSAQLAGVTSAALSALFQGDAVASLGLAIVAAVMAIPLVAKHDHLNEQGSYRRDAWKSFLPVNARALGGAA
jgi:hypothetical protein